MIDKTAPYLARTTFSLIVILFLLGAAFKVTYPFLPAFIWAVTIVVSTWPLMLGIQRILGGSRVCAVVVMTVALLLVLILPLSIALSAVVHNVGDFTQFIRSLFTNGFPEPPEWLAGVPLIGERLLRRWQQVSAMGTEEIVNRVSPYMAQFLTWFVAQIGSFGVLFIDFLVTVIISAVLYLKGETAVRGATLFANKLAKVQGEHVLILSGQAIRAVALGVIVTAFIQSVLAALGFFVAGVPYAISLTCIIFLLAVVQIGAGPVLLFVTIWLFRTGSTFTAFAFLVWALVTVVADNVIRPLLIKAGADLPLLLIFAGVIGGLISFGVIGLFIGPVVLAVSYTLLVAWVNSGERSDDSAPI